MRAARAHPFLRFWDARALPGDRGGFLRPPRGWGRRLYEPLCIAFGTTASSPTVPTYQLYDLPHKFTPRLYMESEDPNLVLREIGVWAGWEQAGSADTRSFLLDLLKDKDAHDNFLLREAGPTRFRRCSSRFQ